MITYTELKQPIEFIVIHHSLTEDGEVVNWQAIKKYHRDKGWTDVGYHYGLDLIGDEVEVMVGRPLNAVGAHVAEQRVNWKSIGICVIGNYDEEVPDEKHMEKLIPLIYSLLDTFKLPVEAIRFHTEFAPYKSCPGRNFNLQDLRKRVAAYRMR